MDPYVGEIKMFAGNFAPENWTFCDGKLLSIADNDALFNLIGTTYGGDGQTNFALPDLRSRVPMHMGSVNPIGQVAGVENVTLTAGQTALHGHPLLGVSTNNATSPANAFPAALAAGSLAATLYGTGSGSLTSLAPQSVGPSTGGNQPHSNIQPYVALTFIICLSGIYPSPN